MPPSEIGLVLDRGTPPEAVPGMALAAESAGLGHLWISEDGFSTGVTSVAALALAATRQLNVGLGVASALARHPAVLAADIAAIGRVFPGRFEAGIGLGAPDWLRQMGLHTEGQLATVRSCVNSIRELLAGDTIDERRGPFTFHEVELTHPPDHLVPLHIGAVGPKMLELSGEIADGTLLSVGAASAYATWAREHIKLGRAGGSGLSRHSVTLIAIYSVSENGDSALAAARSTLAHHLYRDKGGAMTSAYGITDEVAELQLAGPVQFEESMPAQWVEDLTVSGEPDECAAAIESLMDSGVDSVALLPASGLDPHHMLRLTGLEVLPRL